MDRKNYYVDNSENVDITITTAELERWNKNDGETPRYQVMGMPPLTGFDILLIEEGKPDKFIEVKSRNCSSTTYKPSEYFINKGKMDFMYRLHPTKSHLIYLFTDCWYTFRVQDIVNRPSYINDVEDPVKGKNEEQENYYLDLRDGKRNEYKAFKPSEVKEMIESVRRKNV